MLGHLGKLFERLSSLVLDLPILLVVHEFYKGSRHRIEVPESMVHAGYHGLALSPLGSVLEKVVHGYRDSAYYAQGYSTQL